MWLDQYRNFFGCYLDSSVLSAAESDFLLAFPAQVLGPNSDLTEGEKLKAKTGRFKENTALVSSRRRPIVRKVPPGLYATQVMPGRISHFLRTLYEDYGLYEQCRHISLDRWFSV